MVTFPLKRKYGNGLLCDDKSGDDQGIQRWLASMLMQMVYTF